MGWLSGRRPQQLGVRDGQLAPCPGTPNCVSTQARRERQRVEPIPFTGPVAEAREKVLAILAGMPRLTLVTTGDVYLHAEARSALFGFADDVEFLLDPEAGLIHLRCASRLGRLDLGVNRRRAEEIRRLFLAAGA